MESDQLTELYGLQLPKPTGQTRKIQNVNN
jgi:hypothetical protein